MSPGTYYSKSRPILSSFFSETLLASEDMNSLWFCSLRTIICSARDTQFVSWSLIESRQALLYWLWSGPCLLVFRDYFVPWQSSKSILLLNEAEQMSFGKNEATTTLEMEQGEISTLYEKETNPWLSWILGGNQWSR